MGRLGVIFDLDQTLVNSQVNGANIEIEDCSVFPGVIEALNYCKSEEVPCAIVTNQSKQRAQALIDRFFSANIEIIRTAAAKPNVEKTAEAVRALQAKGATQTVSFGDDPKDAITASALDLPFVACHWGRAPKSISESRSEFRNCNFLTRSEELTRLLVSLFNNIRNEVDPKVALNVADHSCWPQRCLPNPVGASEDEILQNVRRAGENNDFLRSRQLLRGDDLYKEFREAKEKGNWYQWLQKHHPMELIRFHNILEATIWEISGPLGPVVLIPTIRSRKKRVEPEDDLYQLAQDFCKYSPFQNISVDHGIVEKEIHSPKHLSRRNRHSPNGQKLIRSSEHASDPSALFLVIDDLVTTGGTTAWMANVIAHQPGFQGKIGTCAIWKYVAPGYEYLITLPQENENEDIQRICLNHRIQAHESRQKSLTNPKCMVDEDKLLLRRALDRLSQDPSELFDVMFGQRSWPDEALSLHGLDPMDLTLTGMAQEIMQNDTNGKFTLYFKEAVLRRPRLFLPPRKKADAKFEPRSYAIWSLTEEQLVHFIAKPFMYWNHEKRCVYSNAEKITEMLGMILSRQPKAVRTRLKMIFPNPQSCT